MVFVKCFDLEEERTGEICNACVLLVKRYLKLPAGSTRNWSHVVDARSGPGIKSLVRSKNKKVRSTHVEEVSNDASESSSPEKVVKRKHVYRRKGAAPDKRKDPALAISGFLDSTYWKR